VSTIATDKQYVIVGMGQTGLSCARFLSRLGRRFTVMDTREAPPLLAEFKQHFHTAEMVLGRLDEGMLIQADEVILSPGVSLDHPVVKSVLDLGIKVRGDIDIFVDYAKAPVIAITGSNGKSTVTTLLGKMAQQNGTKVAVGGNLGTPALELLDQGVELYILELSSFQLETTESLNADCVTLLNISEDHMDRYPSKLAYLQAKQRIFRGAKTVVINDDDALSQPLISSNMSVIHFGLGGQDLKKFSITEHGNQHYLTHGFELLVPVNELALKGRHNLSNALAALALGSSAGLRTDAMLAALRTFPGLTHRCQWVGSKSGVDYINDSKGTNTGATAVAIESFGDMASGKLVLIAGGDSKGADMTPIAEPMKIYGKSAILFGRDARIIADALGQTTKLSFASGLAEAVTLAAAQAGAGDVVLFSPACASFDMFANFEERGEAFVKEVDNL